MGGPVVFLRNLLLLILAGFLSGCATTSETSTIQQNIAMLNERQLSIERRIEGNEGQSRRAGDLYSRVEELQMRLGKLNGKIEELEYKLDQFQRAQAQVQPQAPAAPVQQTEPSNPLIIETPQPARPQQVLPPVATVSPRVAPPAAPIETPVAEIADKAAFEKASHLFQQGKFEAARKDYQALLAKYPKSEFADSAVFNIGECYMSEKRYQDAIESYQQVIDKYPKGGKASQALLKQGTAFQQMGDATAARIIYERLVEKYPGTPAAQAADKKLKQMP